MRVNYTAKYTPGPVAKSGEWKAFRRYKHNDTLIIDHLWKVVKESTDLTFEDLYRKIKEAYRTTAIRSICSISTPTPDDIEVIVKGVFPKFYITRRDV